MKVIVRGKNKYEPTADVIDFVTDKLQKLNQYFKHTDDLVAHVLFKAYDAYRVVEVTIPTKNILLRAEVKATDLRTAIDSVCEKLESQIRKHKDKIYSSIKRREGVSQHYASNAEFDLKELSTEIKANNLVRSKNVKLEAMTPDEAITQMELLDHDFYVFLNSETNKTCIVYIRDDNDYGIIETNVE